MSSLAAPAWLVFSTIVQAGSAIAVALFAGVQWWREGIAKRERRTATDTEASTAAFMLRRQLISWLGNSESEFEDWIIDSKNRQMLGTHIDAAEARAIALANLAAGASKPVATRLRMAFGLFAAGTRRMNEWVNTPKPAGGGKLATWLHLKQNAYKDLQAAITTLESGAIDKESLAIDTELDAIRDAEDPLKQLAAVLYEMSKRKPLTPPPGAT